ncbi:MAG: tetratricopeptide repeat protein [Anaerolineae bacterium]
MTTMEEAKRLYEDGIDAYRAGEYEEALEKLGQARALFAGEGDRKSVSEVLNDSGVVYVQMEAWEQAKNALEEALSIRTELEDRSGQGITLGNLGMMYARQGDEEEAAEAYEQAIEIFRELGERGNEKAVSRQLGKLKIRKGRFLDALGDYQEDLAGEEEPSGTQQVARKLFQFLGRLTGGPAPEDMMLEEDAGDIIDGTSDSAEEEPED